MASRVRLLLPFVLLVAVGCDGSTETPDAGSERDAGGVDAGRVDAGSTLDAGALDAGDLDASSTLDAAIADAGPDAGADGGLDGGPIVGDGGGLSVVSFRVVEDVVLPEGVGETRGVELFTTEAALATYLGGVAPASIDFSTEWAILYTEGAQPFPGHLASVTALWLTADGTELLVDTHHRAPGASCKVLGLHRPAFQLVAFDAPVTAVSAASEQAHATSTFDCAASGAAEAATCTAEMLCGADLICGNLTRGTSGLCYPTDVWDTFYDETAGALMDDGVLVRTISATGLATVDVDVIAYVELTHPDPSELTITLENPDGNVVMVFDREAIASPLDLSRVPVGFSADESVNGTWTLRVTDHAAGNVGTLTRWGLEIVSRWD